LKEFQQKFDIYYNYDLLEKRIRDDYTQMKNNMNTTRKKKKDEEKKKEYEFVDKLLDKKFKNKHYEGKINIEDIINTLKYIFFRHKRGIYVSIRNNKLVNYIYFLNSKFKNNLEKYLNTDVMKMKKTLEELRENQIKEKGKYIPKIVGINTKNELWYADKDIFTTKPNFTKMQITPGMGSFQNVSLQNNTVLATDTSGNLWYAANYKAPNWIQIKNYGKAFMASQYITKP
jgi:hypothetical protein